MESILFQVRHKGLINPSFRSLSPYAQGPAVRQLQESINLRLEALGISDMLRLQIDSWFGNETMSAVKYLQCVGGLPVNGQVTFKTYTFISDGAAGLESLSVGSVGIGVLAVKQVLAACTDIPTAQDGRFCLQTEQAVKAYQRKKGLVEDGKVGKKTWEEIVRSRLTGLPCIALIPNIYNNN
ncbi:MAG: peptidoglycan-binding protein [Cyanobacteria bacterium P01_D01_bin.36]